MSLKNALVLEPFDRFNRLHLLEFNFLLIGHTVRCKLSTRQRDQQDKITKKQVCWNYLVSTKKNMTLSLVFIILENYKTLGFSFLFSSKVEPEYPALIFGPEPWLRYIHHDGLFMTSILYERRMVHFWSVTDAQIEERKKDVWHLTLKLVYKIYKLISALKKNEIKENLIKKKRTTKLRTKGIGSLS